MGFFKPNVKKLMAKGDVEGLIKVFKKYGERDYSQSLWTKEDRISAESREALEAFINAYAKLGYADEIYKIHQQLFPCKPKEDYVTLDRYAIYALAEMGDKRAVKALIEIVQKDATRDAISELGKLKDKRAVEPLIEVLKEIPERGYALRIVDIPSSPETIIGALYVVHALVEIGDERAIEPLKNVLAESKSYAESYVQSYRHLNVEFREDAVSEIESVIKETVKKAIKKIQKGKKD